MTHSTGDKKYNPTLSTLNVKQEEPLNAEPKTVSSLVEAGWLTPVELVSQIYSTSLPIHTLKSPYCSDLQKKPWPDPSSTS